MARKPQPWFREERNAWYVRLNGLQIFLGEHPEGAAKPQKSKKTGKWNSPKSIDEAFRKVLGGGSPVPISADEETVVVYLDAFITWVKQHRAGITANRYEEFCQDFVRATASTGGIKFGAMGISRLTSGHVTDWLQQKEWGPTTQRNAITALIRALNWCCKNKGLARNPLSGMEKPEAHCPMEVVTHKEFDKILPLVLPEFQDLLIVSYDSGARPQEVKRLEARHINLEMQRAVLPTSEAKGKKKPRVIYFPTERSLEILSRLCAKHPEGPIFLNSRGHSWTGNAVKCAFARLDEQVGRRLSQYMFRRAFITRKIIAGVDSHVVAKLSGHQSTAMIDKHYSAIANDHEFMLRESQRDINPKKDG